MSQAPNMAQMPSSSDFTPPGWVDRAPGLAAALSSDDPSPEECRVWRQEMLDWVMDGLKVAEQHNRDEAEPRTYLACWSGGTAEVSRPAVEIACSVMALAGKHAQNLGATIREDSISTANGIPSDPTCRAFSLTCPHERCEGATTMAEAPGPASNAAMESHSPDTGFVAPSTAVTRDVERCGGGDLPIGSELRCRLEENSRIRLNVITAADLDFPIDTGNLIFNDEGLLLAVRSRRVLECAEPSHETLVEFFAEHPEGATISELAKRFSITNDAAAEAIDALSPEFIARRQAERCICTIGRRKVWNITSDRDRINEYIKTAGAHGREIAWQVYPDGKGSFEKIREFPVW